MLQPARRALARLGRLAGGSRSRLAEHDGAEAAAELARAARVLALRARREGGGAFAGAYASAFRGGGLELHELAPYVPGDDVRALDWNALARTGEPYVKRYREERDLALWLALDVSASMRLGPVGASAATAGARAAALLAAAAGRAGDRVGLALFDAAPRDSVIEAARGPAHGWRIVQALASASSRSAGATRLASAVELLRTRCDDRSLCVLISDFRDPELAEPSSPLRAALRALAERSELVCVVVCDPREEQLPRAGLVRVADPERPGATRLLATGSDRARARFRRAVAARRRSLERILRTAGSELLWLRSDRDPLRAWLHFFARRAQQQRRGRGRRGRGARWARASLTLALACLSAVACGREEGFETAESVRTSLAPPVAVVATVVAEPDSLRLGDLASLELRVATGPGYRMLPPAPPALPGAWILDVTPLDPERDAARWIHRARIRLRARELGELAWPSIPIELETPEGERLQVSAPATTWSVVPLLDKEPSPEAPAGLLGPPAERGSEGRGLPGAIALALCTLVGVGVGAAALPLWRRVRRGGAAAAMGPGIGLTAWALRELDRAGDERRHAPRAAANRTARVLRSFTARRFDVAVTARTVPELQAEAPPFVMRSRWPGLLELLSELDELRFASAELNPGDESAGRRLDGCIERARRFVSDAGRGIP